MPLTETVARPEPARRMRSRARAAGSPAARPPRNRPCWDVERRQLWFEGILIKRFRGPASCQEAILAEFQNEGWRCRIDDPLPRLPGKNPKTRLHNAINALNRGHLAQLIKFHNDGHGTGVLWERL